MKLSSLKLARKYLPQAGQLNGECLNSYLVVFDDGSVVLEDNVECYGRLQLEGKKTPIAILNRKQANKFSVEVNKAYDEWLMNDSPYAMAFSSKKWSTIERYGVHVVDCDVPANIMVGGLIATRKPNEHPWIVEIWWELYKRGLHPNLAYVFGHMLHKSDEGIKITNYTTHCSINSDHLPNALIENFWFNTPKKLLPTYSEHKTYSDISATWQDEEKHFDWYGLFTEAVKNSGKGEKESNNPFARTKSIFYRPEAVYDSVVEAINNKLKENEYDIKVA